MQSSVHQNASSKQKYQKYPHIGHSYIRPLIDPPHTKNYLPSYDPAILTTKIQRRITSPRYATAQIYNHVGLIKRIKNSKKPLNCDLII